MSVAPRLILFDIDGTLLMGKGIGREATRRAILEVFGTEGGLAQHNFGGKTDWLTLTEVLSLPAEMVGRQMADYERVLAWHMAAIVAEYQIDALPGALEVIATLRARKDVVLGIVTGNVSSTAPIKLQAAGFDPAWFPIGAFGSEALARDDLPGMALLRAMQYTGMSIAPQQMIVVGDTEADIQCARASGAQAVAVSTGFTPREKLVAAQPDHLLDHLAELLAIVG